MWYLIAFKSHLISIAISLTISVRGETKITGFLSNHYPQYLKCTQRIIYYNGRRTIKYVLKLT